MSEGRATPAGWYPDPSDTAAQRWWNGVQWTEHVAQAAPVAPVEQVAPAVSVPPVVAPVVVPQAVAPAYVAPVTPAYAPAYVSAPAYASQQVPNAGQPAPYGGVAPTARVPEGTPVDTIWIWLIVALPVLGILPLFFWDFQAYMEQSMSPSTDPMLTALGPYTDPWYLAATFGGWIVYGLAVWFAALDNAALARMGYQRRFHWAWAFLSSLVYVIGRSVVVRRQAGRGYLPMAAAIALTVVITIGVVVWTVVMMITIFDTAMEMYPTY
ncbi:DUF2510 domain-containing protein [Agromyces cerinus]|uniref:DUF2510 domain-containing protein n=1 Tax=Agromyces cerinus subsp. cerinus TaxID=232089 RepID=A0A1N6F6X1_9MICO|nr:DUF2510 domain-containing protein [Agromyces cerinus]SIN91010.1 Protein of unknown function [Agromyces cerinus subsp. cerinus]